MWNFRMYEWMATERIARYQREAEQDRRSRSNAVQPGRAEAPAATATDATSSRRALTAAFVGLAAIGALRWRR